MGGGVEIVVRGKKDLFDLKREPHGLRSSWKDTGVFFQQGREGIPERKSKDRILLLERIRNMSRSIAPQQAVNCFAKRSDDGQRLLVSLKNFAPESGVTLSQESLKEVRKMLDKYEEDLKVQKRREIQAAFDSRKASQQPNLRERDGDNDEEEQEDPNRDPIWYTDDEPTPTWDPRRDPGTTGTKPRPSTTTTPKSKQQPSSKNDDAKKKGPLVSYEPPAEISQAAEGAGAGAEGGGDDGAATPLTCRVNKIAWSLAVTFIAVFFILLGNLIYSSKQHKAEIANMLATTQEVGDQSFPVV